MRQPTDASEGNVFRCGTVKIRQESTPPFGWDFSLRRGAKLMTGRSLATVALKTWGLVHAISALASLPAALLIVTASPGIDAQARILRASEFASILNLVLHVLIGGTMVAIAGRISEAILPDTPPLQVSVTTGELQTLAFALVGIVVLVDGLREVAAAAYVLLGKPALDRTDGLSYLWDRESQSIVRAVVQVVAGGLLVFGRDALARGWSRLRGQQVDDDVEAG